MKYEISTLHTKQMLAASLKKFMRQKLLTKISVSELVADCGFNRKTFYYHFEDIYDLLKWTLEQEVIDVFHQFDLKADYQKAILFAMDYLDSNEHFLSCALDSISRDELKRILCQDFLGIMHTLIENVEKDLELHVSEDYLDFLCEFYTGAVINIVVDWVKEKERRNRDTTLHYVSMLFRASLPASLRAGADN